MSCRSLWVVKTGAHYLHSQTGQPSRLSVSGQFVSKRCACAGILWHLLAPSGAHSATMWSYPALKQQRACILITYLDLQRHTLCARQHGRLPRAKLASCLRLTMGSAACQVHPHGLCAAAAPVAGRGQEVDRLAHPQLDDCDRVQWDRHRRCAVFLVASIKKLFLFPAHASCWPLRGSHLFKVLQGMHSSYHVHESNRQTCASPGVATWSCFPVRYHRPLLEALPVCCIAR